MILFCLVKLNASLEEFSTCNFLIMYECRNGSGWHGSFWWNGSCWCQNLVKQKKRISAIRRTSSVNFHIQLYFVKYDLTST